MNGCINRKYIEPNARVAQIGGKTMTTMEIAKQLCEMSLDMDYMDYADYAEEELMLLAKDLDSIVNTELYKCLEQVVVMNGNEELPLLNEMLKGAE